MRLFLVGLIIAAILPCAPATARGGTTDRVESLVEASEILRRAGRPADALHMLEVAEPALAPEVSSLDRARLRLQRVRCAYYQASLAGTPQDANISELRAVLAEASTLADQRLLAEVRDQLGLAIYTRDIGQNDMEEPRRLFEQALASRRKLDDRRGMAESLFHVGLTLENRKDPSADELRRAVASHEQALAIAVAIAVAGNFDIEASYAVRHLAGHQQDAGRLDEALAGFERSLMLRTRAGYLIYLAPALMAVGDVWKAKGNAAKAREYYARALAEADRLGAPRFQQSAKEALAGLTR